MGHPTIAGSRRPPAARGPSRWPFHTTARALLPADPPSAGVTEFGVGVPRRQEVQFKDGSAIWLHSVVRDGTPDLFLRELGEPAQGTIVDLRQLLTDASVELPGTSTRDVAGYVSIGLRLMFATRDEFVLAAVATGRPS